MIRETECRCEKTNETHRPSSFGVLITGMGIGALISLFFAPKSGRGTRKWISDKCFDTLDAANEKVRESRARVRKVMDRSQQQVDEAVAAHRGEETPRKAAAAA